MTKTWYFWLIINTIQKENFQINSVSIYIYLEINFFFILIFWRLFVLTNLINISDCDILKHLFLKSRKLYYIKYILLISVKNWLKVQNYELNKLI